MIKSPITTSIFIERASKVHNSKYDYSKAVYIEYRQRVIIICPIHGEFTQRAGNHLNGAGCTKCAIESRRNTTENFINRCNSVHKDKYDYSLVKYVRAADKVTIKCNTCGNIFDQIARDHYGGHGCPKCKIIKTTGFWSRTE